MIAKVTRKVFTFSGVAIDGTSGGVGEYWNLHEKEVLKITVTTASLVPEEPNQGQQGGEDQGTGGDENTNDQVEPQVRK